jgi:hypothetical protein
MLNWGRLHPWAFATGCAALAFLVCSFVPIWEAGYYIRVAFGSWPGTFVVHREAGTFWAMAGRAVCPGNVPAWPLVELYLPEMVKLSAVLTGGLVIGWLLLLYERIRKGRRAVYRHAQR